MLKFSKYIAKNFFFCFTIHVGNNLKYNNEDLAEEINVTR